MAAIRAARAFTGKKKIIKVGGAYHGWSDQMVYGLHIPGTGRLEAAGIRRGRRLSATQEFFPTTWRRCGASCGATGCGAAPPRSSSSRSARERHAPGSSRLQPPGSRVVRRVRRAADLRRSGDRVPAGHGRRAGLLRRQARPDCLRQVHGRRLSRWRAASAGAADVMSSLRRRASAASGKRAFVGGTLSANPLSCVAGYYAMLEMERTNAPVLAGRAGDRLTQGPAARSSSTTTCPIVAYNQGSIVHLETSGVLLLSMRNPDQGAAQARGAQAHDGGDGRGVHGSRASSRWRAAACTPAWPTPTT